MSDIHVAFASDDVGVQGLAVAAHSALTHARRPVHIWVIEDGIDARTQERLRDRWMSVPTAASVNFIAQKELPIKLPAWWTRARWPLASATRFQLAEMLPADAKRCIYLDIDILVGTDLGELHDTDLAGHPLGMVLNTGMSQHDRDYIQRLGLDPDRYCNAGVLLMDLDAWRQEGAGAGLIELGRRMPADIWFFDQDMLNCYFKDRCQILPERWNYRNASAESAGVIQHFAGSPKPWQVKASEATSIGFVAWHRALAETGFVARPSSTFSRMKKRINARLAQARRRWIRAVG